MSEGIRVPKSQIRDFVNKSIDFKGEMDNGISDLITDDLYNSLEPFEDDAIEYQVKRLGNHYFYNLPLREDSDEKCLYESFKRFYIKKDAEILNCINEMLNSLDGSDTFVTRTDTKRAEELENARKSILKFFIDNLPEFYEFSNQYRKELIKEGKDKKYKTIRFSFIAEHFYISRNYKEYTENQIIQEALKGFLKSSSKCPLNILMKPNTNLENELFNEMYSVKKP